MHHDTRFVGRRRELRALEDAYAGSDSAFVPIYGRRRVGKSELILRFLENKPGVYFLGKKAPAGMQIREFLQEAAAVLEEPLLARIEVADWRGALDAVLSRWNRPGKLILALDEFQWTVEASPELPSLLQEYWDRRWRSSGKLFLILCGSYVGFMEREILGRKSPLFGRRTAQIHLRPFGFREAAEFHPTYSLVDRARTYFLCGGVPLYLRYFTGGRSVETNIAATLLDEFAPLYREADFLLREELREPESYYAILLSLAAGCGANREISAYTGIGERSLHYYLQQLIELGYVSRRYPLTGRLPVARHVRYVLEDPLLRFWFRFVYPNTSFILQMGAQRALADRIRPELDAYFGTCFERLCREALPVLYAEEGITAGFEVGEYWDREVQIDVVGYRDDNWTDLGECRWGTLRGAAALLTELEERVQRYPNPRNATVGRRLFTRKPIVRRTADPPGTRWYSLEDLYGERGS